MAYFYLLLYHSAMSSIRENLKTFIIEEQNPWKSWARDRGIDLQYLPITPHRRRSLVYYAESSKVKWPQYAHTFSYRKIASFQIREDPTKVSRSIPDSALKPERGIDNWWMEREVVRPGLLVERILSISGSSLSMISIKVEQDCLNIVYMGRVNKQRWSLRGTYRMDQQVKPTDEELLSIEKPWREHFSLVSESHNLIDTPPLIA